MSDRGITSHLGKEEHVRVCANALGVAKDTSWERGLFIVDARIGSRAGSEGRLGSRGDVARGSSAGVRNRVSGSSIGRGCNNR